MTNLTIRIRDIDPETQAALTALLDDIGARYAVTVSA